MMAPMGLMEAMLSLIYISWLATGRLSAKANSIPENTWNAATAKIAHHEYLFVHIYLDVHPIW